MKRSISRGLARQLIVALALLVVVALVSPATSRPLTTATPQIKSPGGFQLHNNPSASRRSLLQWFGTSGQKTSGQSSRWGSWTPSTPSQSSGSSYTPSSGSSSGTSGGWTTSGTSGGTTTTAPSSGWTTSAPSSGTSGGTTTTAPSSGTSGGSTTTAPSSGISGGSTTTAPSSGMSGDSTTTAPSSGTSGGSTTTATSTGTSGGSTTTAPSTGSSGSLDSVLQGVLDLHNSYRAKHQAPPLTWDSSVQSQAQAWADRCVFQHSGASGLGENLAMGHASFNQAVDDWYNEGSQYSYGSGSFSSSTGHFTQLVWKSTTSLGCGWNAGCKLYVCNYKPPGNVQGQFASNVLPPVA